MQVLWKPRKKETPMSIVQNADVINSKRNSPVVSGSRNTIKGVCNTVKTRNIMPRMSQSMHRRDSGDSTNISQVLPIGAPVSNSTASTIDVGLLLLLVGCEMLWRLISDGNRARAIRCPPRRKESMPALSALTCQLSKISGPMIPGTELSAGCSNSGPTPPESPEAAFVGTEGPRVGTPASSSSFASSNLPSSIPTVGIGAARSFGSSGTSHHGPGWLRPASPRETRKRSVSLCKRALWLATLSYSACSKPKSSWNDLLCAGPSPLPPGSLLTGHLVTSGEALSEAPSPA
mmetsp:Transcript_18626/g.52620  ORF Transcript_18626/g.52620 Transcript_18626/m.52620 type:complete len:290 (+) Transcript_18626:1503-2372(+)